MRIKYPFQKLNKRGRKFRWPVLKDGPSLRSTASKYAERHGWIITVKKTQDDIYWVQRIK